MIFVPVSIIIKICLIFISVKGVAMEGHKTVFVTPPSRSMSQRPPLASMCMASYLEQNSHRADIIDVKGVAEKENAAREILRRLRKSSAGLMGISCLTTELKDVLSLCSSAKEQNPELKIVTGGIHPTLKPEHLIFKGSPVDFAVLGEGEQTTLELVSALSKGKKVEGVKGLALLKGRGVALTGKRPLIIDLNTLPMPAFDKVPMDFYTKPDVYCIRGVPICGFYTFTSRGCPFNCRFCVNKNIFGQSIRYKDPAKVVDEIQHLKEKYKIDGIYIYDDTFTVSREHVFGICNEMKQRRLDIMWACETRVSLVEESLMRAMKQAGCVQIDFGVESGSQEVLNRLRKGTTVEQARKAFRVCKNVGIRQFANFMINTPDETEEDVEKTIALARELNADINIFNITTPYPGTDIYDWINCEIDPDDYETLAPSPKTYNAWINLLETKYKFSRHNINLGELSERLRHEFPSIHELSFGNPKHFARFVKNISFMLSPRYMKVLLKSKRKGDYAKWLLSIGKMLAAHKFRKGGTS